MMVEAEVPVLNSVACRRRSGEMPTVRRKVAEPASPGFVPGP
jgi:hypothetical protein